MKGDTHRHTILIEAVRLGQRSCILTRATRKKSNASHASVLQIDNVRRIKRRMWRAGALQQRGKQDALVEAEWSACLVFSQS